VIRVVYSGLDTFPPLQLITINIALRFTTTFVIVSVASKLVLWERKNIFDNILVKMSATIALHFCFQINGAYLNPVKCDYKKTILDTNYVLFNKAIHIVRSISSLH